MTLFICTALIYLFTAIFYNTFMVDFKSYTINYDVKTYHKNIFVASQRLYMSVEILPYLFTLNHILYLD